MITRDVIQYYHCAPSEVRELMCQVFCLSDEGLDGKVEERNKGQKALVMSMTETGIQAAALLCDMAPVLRTAMCNLNPARKQAFATPDNNDDLMQTRKVVDLVKDVQQSVLYLINNNVFQKSVEPTVATTFESTPITANLSPIELLIEGKRRMAEYIPQLLKAEYGVWPPMKKGLSYKPPKDKKLVSAAAESSNSDSDND